jgi:hypothetical protein
VSGEETRYLSGPLTEAMLAPLGPECRWVVRHGRLTDGDAARLAAVMCRRPDVHLEVASDMPRHEPVTNLDFLRFFPWLTRLSVSSYYLENISGLTGLANLRSLDLTRGGAGSSVSVAPLATAASSLQHLSLEGPATKLGVLSELTGPKTLTLRSVRLPDLSVLVPIAGLRSLDLKLGGTRDLSALPNFTHLQYFQAWLVRGLSDISPLADVPSLEEIFLEALRNVTELPSLERLTKLREITLMKMNGLTDLTPLLTAPALEVITLTLH